MPNTCAAFQQLPRVRVPHSLAFTSRSIGIPLALSQEAHCRKGRFMEFKREATEDHMAERAEDVDHWLTIEPGEPHAPSNGEAHHTDQIVIPLRRHRAPRIFALLLAGIGLVLILGGSRLLMLGGSLYYVIAGLALVLSSVLLWRRSRLGSLVYGAMLLFTIIWSLWEVGFDGWALLPRLATPLVIGLWFLTPWLNRGLDARRPSPNKFFARHPAATGALALIIAISAGALLHAATAPPIDPIFQAGTTNTIASGAPVVVDQASARGDWLHYGNDQGGSRFSPLDQIKQTNVAK